MAKRTAHQIRTGKKLYSDREKSGKFNEIRSYKRGASTEKIVKRSSASLSIRLSSSTRKKLAARAADKGQDVSAYASDLIEQSVTRPSLDEILMPYRKQVAEGGMSDDELDALHEQLRDRVWSEKTSQHK
jgi:hypothetical protein